MLSDYLAICDEGPDFEPAYPVVAAGMRGGGDRARRLHHRLHQRGSSDLFNAVCELLLQMIARYFAFGHETPEHRKVPAHAAVGLMFHAIEPLGFLLARLPVGTRSPRCHGGSQLPAPPTVPAFCSRTAARPGGASRSASTSWPTSALAFIGRVEDVTATVSGALGGTASNLMSQLEAV